VPVALAGARLPKLTFVPDLEPGLALRLITRLSDRVALTAEESRRYYYRQDRLLVSGYPVRPDLAASTPASARQRLGLQPEGPAILIMGGSRGARSINQAVWANLDELLRLAAVIHLTGDLDWPQAQAVIAGLPAAAGSRYAAFPYLHEEMAAAYSAADLLIARAGASTLGEAPLFSLPSILVPYPHAWRYQRTNAAYLAERGAALVLEDQRLRDGLIQMIAGLLGDPHRLQAMRRARAGLARPNAAARLAAEIERLAA
jgi:UDP-N-acetylglucosamine:LPS N-acetylglucosamine transferase